MWLSLFASVAVGAVVGSLIATVIGWALGRLLASRALRADNLLRGLNDYLERNEEEVRRLVRILKRAWEEA